MSFTRLILFTFIILLSDIVAHSQIYKRITDINELTVGEKYIIVYDLGKNSYVMGGVSGDYMAGVTATITDDMLSLPENGNVITLGGDPSGYTLELSSNPGKYLYCKDKSTYLGETEKIENKAKWTITFEDNGIVRVLNVEEPERYIGISCMNNICTFRCYKEPYSDPVYLYKNADPSISVSDRISFPADATIGEIAYTLNNPVDGLYVAAGKADGADWISDIDVDQTNNKVKFSMSENPQSAPRCATITIKYGEGENAPTKTVEVTQLGKREKHTVTFDDDNSQLSETEFGAGISLPSRKDVSPYQFVGWTIVDLPIETTTAPIVLNGDYFPTSDITLHPVYMRSEDNPTNKTVSVTIADFAKAEDWVNGSKYSSINLNEDITANAIGNANTGKYYTTGDSWRFYSTEDAKMKITSSNDAILQSVTLTFTGESSSKPATIRYAGKAIKTGKPVAVSGTEAIFNVTSVIAYIKGISVDYTKGLTTSHYTSHPGVFSIGADGYSTFYSDKAFVMPDGVCGGIVTSSHSTSDNEGTLSIDYRYAAGQPVPAKTALILKGVKNTYTFNQSTITDAAPSLNMLHGAESVDSEGKTYVEGTDVKYYILSHNASNVYGFFWAAENGRAVKYRAPFAFLAIDSGATGSFAPKQFSLDGTTTDINRADTHTPDTNNKIFSVTGVCLGTDTTRLPKGIYVVNGKKITIK